MRNALFAFVSIVSAVWFASRAESQSIATPANVAAAIEKSISFLVFQQKKDGPRSGSWEGHIDYGAGQTSLVTLALLLSFRNVGW